MKIYVIQIGEDKQRLIEAETRSAAVQFALPVVVQAEVAKAAVVAQLMANGVKVEVAK